MVLTDNEGEETKWGNCDNDNIAILRMQAAIRTECGMTRRDETC